MGASQQQLRGCLPLLVWICLSASVEFRAGARNVSKPGTIFGFSIDSRCSFLSLFRHGRRKVFNLLASVVLGLRTGAVDLRPFEQMEQQGYGPCPAKTQDLVHLELRCVLDK